MSSSDIQALGSGSSIEQSALPSLSRRTFVVAGTAAAAATLISGWLRPAATLATEHAAVSRPAPAGPGSAGGAPGLPRGFSETFTSHYIQAGGLRQHAVIGGDGPPLLLVHGWPQTWYAWRLIMPELARSHRVIAVDQRGIGLTDKPPAGYDTRSLANDLVALMDALGHSRFTIYGTDVGMPIAYAVAADHPDRVERLIVSESPLPGITPSPELFQPPILNARLWHLMFNQLPAEVNEALVRGREDIFLGAEFDSSAGSRKLPEAVVKYYVDMVKSDRDALRGSFSFYRSFIETAGQNRDRIISDSRCRCSDRRIESIREGIGAVMMAVADDVQTVVVPAAHWVAEQAPDQVLEAVTAFLG